MPFNFAAASTEICCSSSSSENECSIALIFVIDPPFPRIRKSAQDGGSRRKWRKAIRTFRNADYADGAGGTFILF
jgi:hypothetical protein